MDAKWKGGFDANQMKVCFDDCQVKGMLWWMPSERGGGFDANKVKGKVKGMLWCQQSELESERDTLMDAK